MATLYVENVPDELYEAVRERARQNRKSIAAEILALLEENVVTAEERKAREQFFRQIKRLRAYRPQAGKRFPSTEDLQRQDRSR